MQDLTAEDVIWTPDGTSENLVAARVISGDSDGDGTPDSQEISGCMDTTACNFWDLATDDIPHWDFLDFDYLVATDSTRIYISKDSMSYAAAETLLTQASYGGHIATLNSVDEAMAVAHKTDFNPHLPRPYTSEVMHSSCSETPSAVDTMHPSTMPCRCTNG